MAIRWHGYCPLGDQCSRRNKQLASTLDRSRVVHAVAQHLHASSYHYLDWESALALADNEDQVVVGK